MSKDQINFLSARVEALSFNYRQRIEENKFLKHENNSLKRELSDIRWEKENKRV